MMAERFAIGSVAVSEGTVLPTAVKAVANSVVGKKLIEIHNAMLAEYREAADKSEGSKLALQIYYTNRNVVEDLAAALAVLEDFRKTMEEGLRLLDEEKAKVEKVKARSARVGCYVVKLVPCGKHCSGCPHGPYAYQVVKVGGKQVWKYLGKSGKGLTNPTERRQPEKVGKIHSEEGVDAKFE